MVVVVRVCCGWELEAVRPLLAARIIYRSYSLGFPVYIPIECRVVK